MLAGATLLVTISSASAASYDIESTFNGWLTSLQDIGSTTFGTGTFQADPPNSLNVALNGLPGVSFAQNGPGSVIYNTGNLVADVAGSGYLEWAFTTPQNGWGGTFEMTQGNGIKFVANDVNLGWIDVTSVGSGQSLGGFLGFTSPDRFSGVRVFMDGASQTSASSYAMRDVIVGSAKVPEVGSTLALLAIGVAGLGGCSRFRRKA
jgi:hypothetical protein